MSGPYTQEETFMHEGRTVASGKIHAVNLLDELGFGSGTFYIFDCGLSGLYTAASGFAHVHKGAFAPLATQSSSAGEVNPLFCAWDHRID